MATGHYDACILDTLKSIDRTLKRIAVALENNSERVEVKYFMSDDSEGDSDGC